MIRSRYARVPEPRAQAGVGLIEVLVALLVLSIGLLGVAALLATSLSTNNSSMARSMAVVSSYSILDAMRADSANAKAGQYDVTNMKASACPTDTSTLAKQQISTWCTQLGNYFGASAKTQGSISCTTLGVCQVKVMFDDSRAGKGGASDQSVTTKAML